ncbi:hypothetical protein OXYTRIMIC_531 [Oxytricha trifallax]|uniref:Uncharacterized protein n=1 Tax=Oxytricha trifallax TaxID=1172189 RepID=A0A073HXY3_9SPIT|nr:hypothetical protein OXYTRIMIC_531 [Oxytricha trifallax]
MAQKGQQIFAKYAHLTSEIKLNANFIRTHTNIDIDTKLKELENRVQRSFDKIHENFLHHLQSTVDCEIQEVKEKIKEISKAKEQCIELNKPLFLKGTMSIDDTNHFYEQQIRKLQLKEKEVIFNAIHKMLPEQFNPQNN